MRWPSYSRHIFWAGAIATPDCCGCRFNWVWSESVLGQQRPNEGLEVRRPCHGVSQSSQLAALEVHHEAATTVG